MQDVTTYIQSGNVLFRSDSADVSGLEQMIKTAILEYFGYDVPVFVRTAKDIKDIMEACPFPQEKKEQSYFSLLHRPPGDEEMAFAQTLSHPNEEFHITGKCIYFFCESGYRNIKYDNNFFERKLKVTATSRNYKTMRSYYLCRQI